MQHTKTIGILGAGTWGVALARLLERNGHAVTVWSKFQKEVDSLNTTRVHPNLPGLAISPDIVFTSDVKAACEGKDILEMEEESFDRVLGINLKGTFFLTQYTANKMIEGGFGDAIINVTSMSAYTASISRGEYCISKAGVSMITSLFADRLAEYEIPVFEVRPGIIRTDMTACVTEKYNKLIGEGITPIRRWGEGKDVANCVWAAASGLLDFGTGTVLNADGGFHLRRL